MAIRPFSLERFFARHEFTARRLLGSSDPEALSVAELLALEPGAAEGLGEVWLGYTESTGDPALRRDIAGLYGTAAAEDILVFTGAEEPIFAFMNVALGPGDHLVAHSPGYQSHFEVAKSAGAEVSLWEADPERGWALDPAELKRLLRPNTRAILVSAPHNPTGFLFSRDAWLEVVDIARRAGVWLFSDEVYRGLEQDPGERLPAACDLYERAVSLNCLSKAYGLAGLRLGWLASHDRFLMGELAAFKDYLTICTPAPSEFLGGIAVRHAEALFARSRNRLKANLDLLEGFLERRADLFSWRRPRAGSTTFPRLRQGGADAFCAALLRDTGIMLVPSSRFDYGDAHLRFGYGRRDFPEALDQLERYLQ
ncbi:MAG: aminotransferase class I/II-fold pyridoxal phosphate-dependent enzyme [Holophaga sp.]|nr:aminotransferase class I/II-fold pyridoxal phosphate-dependent enzyme [Holophaga sp.]